MRSEETRVRAGLSAVDGKNKSIRSWKTYNDDRAGDGDGGQHAVSDGVRFERVLDAFVVAVHAPLVRFEDDGHDDEG